MRAISLDDLITNFKSALSSHCKELIKAMWDGSPLLRAWFSGQQVSFGNNTFGQPDMRAISLDDLITNFKSALSSRSVDVIKAMWDGNQVLHNAIKSFDFNSKKLLLKKVMGSNKNGKSDFITLYVNWTDDISVIRAVSGAIKTSCKGKTSTYKTNQISLLENRLKNLAADTTQHDGATMVQPQTAMSTNSGDQLTAPAAQNTQSRKRKATSEATASRRKKQRTETTSSELSHLVNKMPSLLTGSYFFVEQSLGLDLQKLPKTVKDEMGIHSIRKTRNQTSYKVEISDPSKYSAARQKYASQPSDEESHENNLENIQDQPTHVIHAPPPPEYHVQKPQQTQDMHSGDNRFTSNNVDTSLMEDFYPSTNNDNTSNNQNGSTGSSSFSEMRHDENHLAQQEIVIFNNGNDSVDNYFLEDTFLEDTFLEDTFNINQPILSAQPSESNISSIALSNSSRTTPFKKQSSPTLFGHLYNAQTTNTFVANPTIPNEDNVLNLSTNDDQDSWLNSISTSTNSFSL